MSDFKQIAEAIDGLSHAIQRLGNADASTHLGGLEALGMAILEASENIQNGLSRVARAISDRNDLTSG